MSKDIDILLINVGGTKKKVYQSLSKDYSAVDTPFWAALTAGFIRKNGFSVHILDAGAENLDFVETALKVKEFGARFAAIVCYSQQANVCTPIMVAVGELCRQIKALDSNQKLILSGWHPSALPERTLREEACDYVIQGEGFHAYLAMLRGDKIDKVPNLWWVDNGNIRHNARSDNTQDLTHELDDVAWDLLPMRKGVYRAFNWMCLQDLQSRDRFASIFTSLGCPFKCKFCAIHATYGEHKIRYWSPDWVLRQIDILVKNYDIKNINIHDELFVFNRNHYLPIAEGLIQRNYDLNICAFARVDVIHKLSFEDLSTLKRAGFNWFKLGIETGNTEIIKGISKGQYTKDIICEVVHKIHNSGINLCANFMFGLPGDTAESMQETFDFALELKCAFPSFFCTMAIPGSELYDEALKKHIPLPDSWLAYASQGYDFFPLPTETLSSASIVKFRDYAFNTYFSNPSYLGMIEQKFGLLAREHIEGMTAIKLKRKLLE